jgi:hypothetical protein
MVGQLDPGRQSHTQVSPPSWLATTLSRRKRTGSDSAFKVVANWMAASAESGSRTSGAKAQPGSVADGDSGFDIHQY